MIAKAIPNLKRPYRDFPVSYLLMPFIKTLIIIIIIITGVIIINIIIVSIIIIIIVIIIPPPPSIKTNKIVG